jgi:hypothetical protein
VSRRGRDRPRGPLPDLRNAYSGIVPAIAECSDCGWASHNYKNALATSGLCKDDRL